MKRLVFVFAVCLYMVARTQDINVTPRPVKMDSLGGFFNLSPSTVITYNQAELGKSIVFFNDYLKRHYGFRLTVEKQSGTHPHGINFGFRRLGERKPGAYELNIKDQIVISGEDPQGVFYGMQTLIQLLPVHLARSLDIPRMKIKDYPRFAYRGLMLDCGRHFFNVEFIKKYIDFIALQKMNTFHWHLTDDQGWRIEIKKYPLLTQIGSCRNGTIIGHYPGTGNDSIKTCGFYTQEQIKEIVRYAADRYVTVIPEIEMPGHSSAAIAAYPQLSCFPGENTPIARNVRWAGPDSGKQVQQSWGVYHDIYCPSEFTFRFLEDVLDEVMKLFPSKYIHIGGDECPKDYWKRSPFCQNLIKEKGLKNEDGLQSYFIRRIEQYLNSKGKSIIGWDEILEGGVAPNATIMSWRGEQGGIQAAKEHHNVIMTPTTYVYFDYSQTKNEDSLVIGGYLPLGKVYNYEPVPPGLSTDEAKYILGAQANVWTEYMSNPDKVEYMIFPRLTALSEVLWSPKEAKSWGDFQRRLPGIFKRYEFWGCHYSTAYDDIQSTILPASDHKGLLWKLESNDKEASILVKEPGDGISTTDSFKNYYSGPIPITHNTAANVYLCEGSRLLQHFDQKFSVNKATGKSILLNTPPDPKFPGNGGAFGLVNGIITDKGISADEWLGWSGTDVEGVIDLGKEEEVYSVSGHFLNQKRNQVYPPALFVVYASPDQSNFALLGKSADMTVQQQNTMTMGVQFAGIRTRYIKFLIRNAGTIPDGQPGAGRPCWTLCDELSVN